MSWFTDSLAKGLSDNLGASGITANLSNNFTNLTGQLSEFTNNLLEETDDGEGEIRAFPGLRPEPKGNVGFASLEDECAWRQEMMYRYHEAAKDLQAKLSHGRQSRNDDTEGRFIGNDRDGDGDESADDYDAASFTDGSRTQHASSVDEAQYYQMQQEKERLEETLTTLNESHQAEMAQLMQVISSLKAKSEAALVKVENSASNNDMQSLIEVLQEKLGEEESAHEQTRRDAQAELDIHDSQLRSQINSLTEEINALQISSVGSNGDKQSHEAAQSQIDGLVDTIRAQNEVILGHDKLISERDEIMRERDRLNRDLAHARALCKAAEEEGDTLRDDLTKMQDEYEAKIAAMPYVEEDSVGGAINDDISTYKEQMVQCEAVLRDTQASLQRANEEVRSLREQLASLQSAHDSRIATLSGAETNHDRVRAELENLQNEVHVANAKASASEEANAQLEAQIAEAQASVEAGVEARGNLLAKIAAMEADFGVYTSELDNAKADKERLQSEVEKVQKELNHAEAEKIDLRSRLTHLRTDLEGKLAALSTANAEAKSLHDKQVADSVAIADARRVECDNLRTELLEAQNVAIKATHSEVGSQQSQLAEMQPAHMQQESLLRDPVTKSCVACSASDEQCHMLRAELDSMWNRATHLENDVLSMQNMTAEMKNIYNEAKQRIAELESEQKEFSNALRNSEANRDSLHFELAEVQAEHQHSIEALAKARMEYENLNETRNSLQTEFLSLRTDYEKSMASSTSSKEHADAQRVALSTVVEEYENKLGAMRNEQIALENLHQSTMAKLQSEIDAKTAEVAVHQERLTNLENETQTSHTTTKNNEEQLQATIQSYATQVADLQNITDNLSATIADQQSRLEQSQLEMERLQGLLVQKEQECFDAEQLKHTEVAALTDLLSQKDGIIRTQEQHERERSNAEEGTQASMYNDEIVSLQTIIQSKDDALVEISEILNSVLSKDVDVSNTDQIKMELAAFIQNLETSNYQAEMRLGEMEQNMQNRIDGITQAKNTIAELEQKQSTLQAEKLEMQEHAQIARRRIDEYEELTSSLKQQVIGMSTNIAADEAARDYVVDLEAKLKKKDVQVLRLQEHLMEREDAHTSDALEREKVIEDLQQKLNNIQERVAVQSEESSSSTQHLEAQVLELAAQLEVAVSENNALKEQLRSIEASHKQLEGSLKNLRLVIASNETEKEEELSLATGGLKKSIRTLELELRQCKEEIAMKEDEVAKGQAALEQLQIAHHQHQARASVSHTESLSGNTEQSLEDENMSLRLNLVQLQDQLASYQAELAKGLMSAESDVIDKGLMRNFIVQYVSSGKSKDTMQVMANLLDFDAKQKELTGLGPPTSLAGRGLSYFGSFVNPGLISAPEPRRPSEVPIQSFAESFVDYLLEQSAQVERQATAPPTRIKTANGPNHSLESRPRGQPQGPTTQQQQGMGNSEKLTHLPSIPTARQDGPASLERVMSKPTDTKS
ncbi:hypothetical protein SARC_05656 [Sphaeroforma arctica JP610]|uniref:GRIP domain-containing protein n=1 Tax=Sphaeroforma arctica JP610 TaxID=667725 RepID=A0A0L0G1M2_9EUKA|nr:hypothetical protein SARC_05656 [Sphaeroforma arctica JP610]KNC82063.1 hypothetical protein SARC_05656 [Sphaeroforma arctica JP610]|eukprot:XP_014155965.1 hypothetical protein SARC_05656 [Sphaeroforma arctica JP610]